MGQPGSCGHRSRSFFDTISNPQPASGTCQNRIAAPSRSRVFSRPRRQTARRGERQMKSSKRRNLPILATLIGLLASVHHAHAQQTPPAPAQPPAIKQKAVDILKAGCEVLAGAKAMSFDALNTYERAGRNGRRCFIRRSTTLLVAVADAPPTIDQMNRRGLGNSRHLLPIRRRSLLETMRGVRGRRHQLGLLRRSIVYTSSPATAVISVVVPPITFD